MSRDDRGLSDEERRLRAFLEDRNGSRHPTEDEDDSWLEWPEHLAMNHPELFPRRRRKPEPRIGRGTRRLLLIAVPVVLLLVWAEATNSLIGSAWLLALLASLIAFSFWVGFLAPPWLPDDDPARIVVLGFEIYYRAAGQAGFLVLLGVFALASYFGWREHRTLDEDLARIIPPIPEIVDVTYVPTASEMLALEAFMGGLPQGLGDGSVPQPSAVTEGRALEEAAAAAHAAPTYWLVETRLDTARVAAFYDDAGARLGWDVATPGPGVRVLRRGPERLLIFTTDDWPRPNTKVLYLYTVSGGP